MVAAAKRTVAAQEALAVARARRAENRAIKMMKEVLGEAQAISYIKHGYVEVVGGKSKDHYRINSRGVSRSQSPNFAFAGRISRYCVAPTNRYNYRLGVGTWPRADRVLTLALWVRGDETGFLKIANLQ